ncbi:MAG: TIGR03067 domain-containing protein [Pirellulaceae bacterium]
MRFGVVLALAVICLLGAAAPEKAATPDADVHALQGEWVLRGGEAEGEVLTEDQLQGGKLIIEGDRYTVTLPELGVVSGIETLDATQQPKTIDITDTTGPHVGQVCLGVYELAGDEFRVVFASPGGQRPTKFETKPASGQWMHVWTRVAK